MYQRLNELIPLKLGKSDYREEDIRLNLSENTLPWDEKILQDFFQTLSSEDLIYYPHDAEKKLAMTVSEFLDLKPGIEVVFGNGSFELLNTLFQVFCLPKANILTANPDFFMYGRLSEIYSAKLHMVDVDENLELPIERFIQVAKQVKPNVIFLSNPNNPTTKLLSLESIESIVSNTQAIVIIDEAYGHYAGQSAQSLIEKYSNLVVLQTVSKVGLAGLRLGYLLCHEKIAATIRKCVLPFPINAMTLKLVEYLMRDKSLIQNRVNVVISERERLASHIQKIPGFKIYPSHTNFINVSHENMTTMQLCKYLAAKRIIVTPSNIPDFLPNCVRIGIGQKWQNELLLEILDATLN